METSSKSSANENPTDNKPGNERAPLITKSNDESIDRGWAWMVLAGSVLCHVLFTGQFSCYGVLYVQIRERLDIRVVEVSVIGSLRNGLMFFFVVFTSPLCDVMGCRVMAMSGGTLYCLSYLLCYICPTLAIFYVSLGVITGFATALVYSSSLIIIKYYFEKKRSMSFALTTVASALGGLIFSPITTYLLDEYGFRGTLLINAGLSLNVVVGGMLFFPQTKDDKGTEEGSKTKKITTVIESYKDQWFWKNTSSYIMMTSSFCVGFGIYVPYMLMPSFMVSQDIPLSIAALSMTTMTTGSIIGGLLAGAISYAYPSLNRVQYFCGNFVCSMSLFAVPVLDSQNYYLALSGLYGFCEGIISSSRILLLVDLFGTDRLPVAFGITSFTLGIGSSIGAPLASAVADIVPITGVEYVVSGAFLTSAGILLLPISVCCCEAKSQEG